MSDITITAGGKPGAFRGEPGVYSATLVTHTLEGPFKSKDPKTPGETFKLHEWGFAIDGDDLPDDERMVWITSGESTGPKSKTFGILTALLNGKAIPIGTTLNIETHLIGRQALVDVRENDRGYLDCVAVTPPLKSSAAKPAAKAAPAAAVKDDDEGLPF